MIYAAHPQRCAFSPTFPALRGRRIGKSVRQIAAGHPVDTSLDIRPAQAQSSSIKFSSCESAQEQVAFGLVEFKSLIHFVVLGQRHLDNLAAQWLEQYHEERPHQAKDNDILTISNARSATPASKQKRGPSHRMPRGAQRVAQELCRARQPSPNSTLTPTGTRSPASRRNSFPCRDRSFRSSRETGWTSRIAWLSRCVPGGGRR